MKKFLQPVLAGVLLAITSEAGRAEVAPANAERGNGVYVAVERTNILTSRDGKVWTRRSPGTESALKAVTFGRGTFVVVGNEGVILSSKDGLKWRSENSRTDERLRGITYGNGLFVAVGYSGTIVTSRDGHSWTPRRSPRDNRLQSVAYGEGTFVAVGWNGSILSSHDGSHWAAQKPGVTHDFVKVSYENGLFVLRDKADLEHTAILNQRGLVFLGAAAAARQASAANS
jgi:hypothetical protein